MSALHQLLFAKKNASKSSSNGEIDAIESETRKQSVELGSILIASALSRIFIKVGWCENILSIGCYYIVIVYAVAVLCYLVLNSCGI